MEHGGWSFLNLIRHLEFERNLVVVKTSPRIYYISKEIFKTLIIVTGELSPKENLYLQCPDNHLKDSVLINCLADDYIKHKDLDIYTKYLNQPTITNLKTKGDSSMVYEGLFNLFGTTSEEVIARAKKESEDYYLSQLNELSSNNKALSSQIDYLKNLLIQNNIAFNLKAAMGGTNVPNQ